MKILKNEPLKQHTSFRVGGPAKVYVVPEDIEELQKLIRFLHEEKLPYDIIGNGTNLLVVAFGVAVVFSPGHLIYRIENHVRMNVLFIHMNANDDLVVREVFFCKRLRDLQCQLRRDLTGLE